MSAVLAYNIFCLKAATCITAGIVTRYAAPAISNAVHNPVITHPIGPLNTAKTLVVAAFPAKDSPLPINAFKTAFTTMTVNW